MAAKANILVDQGTTFNTLLNLTDTVGDPFDLTGYSAQSQIRQWYTSSNSVSFTTAISTPTAGSITLSLSANTTAGMLYQRYVYDVVIIDSSNNITRVVEGILTVNPAATQITGVNYSEPSY